MEILRPISWYYQQKKLWEQVLFTFLNITLTARNENDNNKFPEYLYQTKT